ncbi:MAG: hypothetical protein SAJ37_08900 [Oscillatoria sp. PMC 1068.18]|nr:hypothetical protein [Oscillatoria sp. PMC 1068.18]
MSEYPYLTNWEALKKLEEEDQKFTKICKKVGLVTISILSSLTAPLNLLGVLTVVPIKVLLDRLEKINRTKEVMKALLEEFGDEIIATYRIPVPGQQPIDLWVRFPGRAMLLISIRSKGKKKVIFNEKNQTLCVRQKREKGGLTKWKPDPLTELGTYQLWLKKNRRELGLSSNESNRPTAKVLVLSGETDIESHNKHLYLTMNNNKFLWIQSKSNTFLIRKEEIVDFAKSYLAYQAEKRKQTSKA